MILNFDKSASIYKEEEKLESPGQGGGRMRMMSSMMGGGGTYYKNVKEKAYTVDKEFLGKEFLVKDALPNLKFKMEGETRVIVRYNCFKATAALTVNSSDFINFRPKREEKEAVKTEDKEKKANFLSDLEMLKESIVTLNVTP